MVGYVLNLLHLYLLFHPFNLTVSQNIIKLVIILYIVTGIGREARNQKNLIYNIVLFAAAATSFSYNPFASAEPVAPDVKGCNKPTLPQGVEPLTCCPPNFEKKEPIDYVIPNYQTLRIRKPAHDYDNLEKYKKAVNIIKSLPDDHPHSWTQQSRVHCAYCTNSYHFSWIFLPFHRWYLYFYERILGKLINDPNFTIPFWNWDAPEGMEIPAIFIDKSSPLYNARRNQNHQPPMLVDLNWNGNTITHSNYTVLKAICRGDRSGDVKANLATMYRQVYEVKRPICFYGKPFRAGQKPYSLKTGSDSIELVPHNTIHSWTGDSTQPNDEDMGAFYAAARDPIFYSHHANVDRIWTIWKSFGRNDVIDPDYQNASYVFYDENENLVRVKNNDAFDTKKLGYDYKQLDLPWLKAKPDPRMSKRYRHRRRVKKLDLPFTLLKDKIVSTVVKRPKINRSQVEKDEKEESLVFSLQFDRTKHLKFDVLINEEEDYKRANPKYRVFAGSFVSVSHASRTSLEVAVTETTFSIGITDLLEQLDVDDEESIVVTLVPEYGDEVIIKDINISFEECKSQ
ncbi:hypothetical protein PIB30_006776 [Stylosanthes scabra]|uniref:Tyrosinase copper-binding domain-containing protein n=1 Tax=Stylosanthes scabra TaxID=79078 RepID=A0ABU6U5W4_9FABA|nr:hypothetical protein [Stylosanthes scabra]